MTLEGFTEEVKLYYRSICTRSWSSSPTMQRLQTLFYASSHALKMTQIELTNTTVPAPT